MQPGNVRWIAITGLEPSVVIRLANRYRLHPLQVGRQTLNQEVFAPKAYRRAGRQAGRLASA